MSNLKVRQIFCHSDIVFSDIICTDSGAKIQKITLRSKSKEGKERHNSKTKYCKAMEKERRKDYWIWKLEGVFLLEFYIPFLCIIIVAKEEKLNSKKGVLSTYICLR
jgi:hypothetical protein